MNGKRINCVDPVVVNKFLTVCLQDRIQRNYTVVLVYGLWILQCMYTINDNIYIIMFNVSTYNEKILRSCASVVHENGSQSQGLLNVHFSMAWSLMYIYIYVCIYIFIYWIIFFTHTYLPTYLNIYILIFFKSYLFHSKMTIRQMYFFGRLANTFI